MSKDIYAYLIKGEYTEAIKLYEQAILEQPSQRRNYGYLGLALLLQGNESEAQVAWFNAVDDLGDLEAWTTELDELLDSEAERYTKQTEFSAAYLIRQYLAEISSQNIYNFTELTRLSLEQGFPDEANQYLSHLITFLQDETIALSQREMNAIEQLILKTIADSPHTKIQPLFTQKEFTNPNDQQKTIDVIKNLSEILKFDLTLFKLYLQKKNDENTCNRLLKIIVESDKSLPKPAAILYLETAYSIFPAINYLRIINLGLQDLHLYRQSIDNSLLIKTKNQSLFDEVSSSYLVARAYLASGYGCQEANQAWGKLQDLLEDFIKKEERSNTLQDIINVAKTNVLGLYLNDFPINYHSFNSKLGTYYQFQISQELGNLPAITAPISRLKKQKLKIAYICENLRRHSVGWISRWLLTNHNLKQIDVFVYSLAQSDDNVQNLIKQSVTQFFDCTLDKNAIGLSIVQLALEIQNNEIDILIDLDSLTSPHIPAIMALKPAPIQVTWLGSDASGIPAIDYFIADPYVLPKTAEDYYNCQIWRLPQTYLAVNGFEVGVPSLSREDLNIPHDAIVYLCVQSPKKLRLELLKAQIQIVKQVPNSYLLIKNPEMTSNLESYIVELSTNEGLSPDRLRFLYHSPTEEIHRANLAIADVFLDTYPYNGTTTTLEALWMEIPVVTRVGESFVSRSGYTLMSNVGITEGIAWNNQEYIEWGIKLGNDLTLRQQISLKLKQSKRTAPLWNAKQFAREMELAYQQMWDKHIETEIQHLSLSFDHLTLEKIAAAEESNKEAIRIGQKGELDAALILFEKAIDLNPEYADAHYNMSVLLKQLGNTDAAIEHLQLAIKFNPQHSLALYNLGSLFIESGNIDQAINNFQHSLAISPYDLDTCMALGDAYLGKNNLGEASRYYEKALTINAKSPLAHCKRGLCLSYKNEQDKAVYHIQNALDLEADFAFAYECMAFVLGKSEERFIDAIHYCEVCIELAPKSYRAYWLLLVILNSPTVKIKKTKNFKHQKDIVDRMLQNCDPSDSLNLRIILLLEYITIYNQIGLSHRIKDEITKLESLIYNNNYLSISADFHGKCVFTLISLRDNQSANSKLFNFIGQLYVNKHLETIRQECLQRGILKQNSLPNYPRKLKIGFLSANFCKHSVGWCSINAIQELSLLTPHIYLYSLNNIKPDALTEEFVRSAEKVHFLVNERNTNIDGDLLIDSHFQILEMIQQIQSDQIDVLIDLDSVTVPSQVQIMYCQPAPVCISWLGFDAPYVNPRNYFLCDWYTNPNDVDKYYTEKLIRVPNSHIAVSGFEAIPVDIHAFRKSMDIRSEQIVYLYIVQTRKFNLDSVKAHLEILKQVPDSILIYKGFSDIEFIHSLYTEICELLAVDFSRIKFIPRVDTQEEHRAIYSLADVFLDAYPFNGSTTSLEALWFNLPIVTRVGEQYFARMGYSFLQSVGINEGIAKSWEEFVEWGVKMGKDSNLRNSIKNKLIASKDTQHLSPLWNPKKLANDMYTIFEDLVADK